MVIEENASEKIDEKKNPSSVQKVDENIDSRPEPQ